MIKCDYCGAEGFHWEQVDKVWKLTEPDGEYHSCRPEDFNKEAQKRAKEKAETEALLENIERQMGIYE